MKTDQLIDMLSTNVEPVQQGRLRKTLVWGPCRRRSCCLRLDAGKPSVSGLGLRMASFPATLP